MLLLRLIRAHNATAELSSVGFNDLVLREVEESDRVVELGRRRYCGRVWFAIDPDDCVSG